MVIFFKDRILLGQLVFTTIYTASQSRMSVLLPLSALCIAAYADGSSDAPPGWDSAYSPSAFYVAPSAAGSLAALLAKHKRVR